MKKTSFLLLFLLMFPLIGCQGRKTSAITEKINPNPSVRSTLAPTRKPTSTPLPPTPTVTARPTKTDLPTLTSTSTATPPPTYPPETRVKSQCLDILPAFPRDKSSSGSLIMESREIVNGRYKSDTYLLNMSTGEKSVISYGSSYAISTDRTFMAFERVVIDDQDQIVSDELLIANTDGQVQKIIPWEDQWLSLLNWTNDQRLLLAYNEPITTTDGYPAQVSYLVLDPFSGEQQMIYPDYPHFLDVKIAPGWWGVVYDPSLTRAIYAQRYMDDGEKMYTLALWDVEGQQLIATMEDYYAYYPVFKSETPLPRWSQDGSKFAFRGQFLALRSDERVTIELYQADRDGQVEQLTHLGLATNSVPARSFNWSPDGRYIAMYLEDWDWQAPNTRVALLDTETQEVIDYCIPIGRNPPSFHPVKEVLLSPIWAPDNTQFLVVDRYEKDHQRVILVDVVQGFAAVIAEDVEPVGWMISPQK